MSIFTEFYAQLVGNVELKRKWWHLSKFSNVFIVLSGKLKRGFWCEYSWFHGRD